MRRGQESDDGSTARTAAQASTRSISSLDRLTAVVRETFFRLGRRPWTRGWLSRGLQVVFFAQIVGLSIDPSLGWSPAFRQWSVRLLGGLLAPSAAANFGGTAEALLAAYWVAFVIVLLLLAGAIGLSAAVFTGAPTPGFILGWTRAMLRVVAIPLLPSIAASMLAPLRCNYDGTAVAPGDPFTVGVVGSAGVFEDIPALNPAVGVSMYPIQAASTLSMAQSLTTIGDDASSGVLEVEVGPVQCWAGGSPMLGAAVTAAITFVFILPVIVLAAVVPFTTSPLVYDAFATASPSSALVVYGCLVLIAAAQALLAPLRFWQHVAQMAFAAYAAWVLLRRMPFIWTSTNILAGGALVAVSWAGLVGFAVEQVKITGDALLYAQFTLLGGCVIFPIIATVVGYQAALLTVAKAIAEHSDDASLERSVKMMRSSHYILDKAHSRINGRKHASSARTAQRSEAAAGLKRVGTQHGPALRKPGERSMREKSFPDSSKSAAIGMGSPGSEMYGEAPPLSAANPRIAGGLRNPARLASVTNLMSDEEETSFDQPWAAELASRWTMMPHVAAAAARLGSLVASGAVASGADSEQRGRSGGNESRSGQPNSAIGHTGGFRGTMGTSGMPLAVADGSDEEESLAGVESAPLALRIGIQALAKAAGDIVMHRAEAVWDAATEEHPRSAWLWIAYGCWLAEVIGDSARGTAAVSAAARLETGWMDRILLYIVERRLVSSRAGSARGSSSGLDLAGYVEFTRQMRVALKAHRRVLIRIRTFWRTVQALKERRRAILRARGAALMRAALSAARAASRRRMPPAPRFKHVGEFAANTGPASSLMASAEPSLGSMRLGAAGAAAFAAGADPWASKLGSAEVGAAGQQHGGSLLGGIAPSLVSGGSLRQLPPQTARSTARSRVAVSASIRLPLRRLSRQCSLVDEDARTAEAIYRALIERYPSNTKVLRAAARFLMDVQLAQAEGERYVAEADKIETEGAEEEDTGADGGRTLAGRAGELSITTAVDDATDALVVINAKGIILSANSNTRRMFGRAESELVGRNVSVLMPPTYAHQHDRFISRYLSTGIAHVLGSVRRVEGLHRDGFTFPIEIAINRVDTPQGITFAGVIHQLREDEASGVLTLNRKGIVVTCNRTFAKQFGWSIRAVTGKSVRRFMPRKDQKSYEATARRAGAAGQATSLAKAWTNGLSKHGMCFPIAVEAAFEGEGAASLIRCKITELSSAHGVLTMDARGLVQSCNSALLALFGFAGTSDIVGRNVTILMPEPYATFHQSYIERFLATGKGRIVGGDGRYVQGKRVDGQIIDIFLRVSAVRDSRGKRLFAGNIELASKRLAATGGGGGGGGAQAAGDGSASPNPAPGEGGGGGGGSAADDSDPLLGRVTINERGLIQFVNRQVVAMFGFSHEKELLGQNVKILTPPEIAKNHDSFVARRVAGGEARVIGTPGRHMLALHADGHLFPMSLAVEEERVGSHRVFHGTIRTLADLEAQIIADYHGKILHANDAMGFLLGYKLTSIIGKNVRMIMPRRFAEDHDAHLRRYRQTGQVRFTGRRQIVPALHSDGTEVTVQAEIAKVVDARFGECLAARFTAAPMSAHEAEVLVQKRVTEIDDRNAASSSVVTSALGTRSSAPSMEHRAAAPRMLPPPIVAPQQHPPGCLGRSPGTGRSPQADFKAAPSRPSDATDAAVAAPGPSESHADLRAAVALDSVSGVAGQSTAMPSMVMGGATAYGQAGASRSAEAGSSFAAVGPGSVSGATDAAAGGSDNSRGVEDGMGAAAAASSRPSSPRADEISGTPAEEPVSPPMAVTGAAKRPGAVTGSSRRKLAASGRLTSDDESESKSEKDIAAPTGPGVVPLLDAQDELVNPLIVFSTPTGDPPDLGAMNDSVAQDISALGRLPLDRAHIAPDPAMYHKDDEDDVRRSAFEDNGRVNIFDAATGRKPSGQSTARRQLDQSGRALGNGLGGNDGNSDGAADDRSSEEEGGAPAPDPAILQLALAAGGDEGLAEIAGCLVGVNGAHAEESESLDGAFIADAAEGGGGGAGGGGGDRDDRSEASDGTMAMTGAARRSHRQRMKQLRRVKRSQLIRRSVAALRTAFRASLGLFAVLLVAEFAVTLSVLQVSSNRLAYVTGAADRAVSTQRMPLYARNLQVAAEANSTSAILSARVGLWTASEAVRRLGVGLEVGIGSGFTAGSPSARALDVYSRRILIARYVESADLPGYRLEETSVFDAATAIAQAAATLAPGTEDAASSVASTTAASPSPLPSASGSQPQGEPNAGTDSIHAVPYPLATNPSWRYIMDNAATVGASLSEAAHEEAVAAVDVLVQLQHLAIILGAILIVLPGLASLSIIAPALEKLEDDRQAMFRTFFLLPSNIISSLASKSIRIGQSNSKDDSDEDVSAGDGGGGDSDGGDGEGSDEGGSDEEDDDESVLSDHGQPAVATHAEQPSMGSVADVARTLAAARAAAAAKGDSLSLDGASSGAHLLGADDSPGSSPRKGCCARACGCIKSTCLCVFCCRRRSSSAVLPDSEYAAGAHSPVPQSSAPAKDNEAGCCGRICWRVSRVASQPRLVFLALVIPLLVVAEVVAIVLLAWRGAAAVHLMNVAGAHQAHLEILHSTAQELVLARSVVANGTSVALPPRSPVRQAPNSRALRAVLADTAATLESLQNTLLFGYNHADCSGEACAWGSPWQRVSASPGPKPEGSEVLTAPEYEVPSPEMYRFLNQSSATLSDAAGRPLSRYGAADAVRISQWGAVHISRDVRDLLLLRQCATTDCLPSSHRLFIHGHMGFDAMIRSMVLQAAKLAGDVDEDLAPQNGRFAMISWLAQRDATVGIEAVRQALLAVATDATGQMYGFRSALFVIQLLGLSVAYQIIFGPIIRQVSMETTRVATFLSFLPSRIDIRKLMGVSLPSGAMAAYDGDSGGRA
ncbi:hypothetical protein FNF28_06739 [Cafeteria roenbergensis]|uniref:PAS domain-containing protein n=1 Tax=Cafeteria roenbergensis TaxID=33653 RepID=A0A5A8CQ79_CAFRO|nr:hypothetical protein FNF28_06739 [Cafeteria roenbergensis]